MGKVIVRIITKKDTTSLIEALRSEGYGVTCVEAKGATGCVNIVYTIIDRVELQNVVSKINEHNPKAFYSIEEVGFVEKGIFPVRKTWNNFGFSNLFRPFRKAK